MHQENEADDLEGAPRRFDVEIFIVHPEMTPSEITSQLGVEPQNAHCVGDTRVAPNGRVIGGRWPDTRWRYSIRYERSDQWFVKEFDLMVDRLVSHKSFLLQLRS